MLTPVGLHLTGNQQCRMAKAKQCLAIIDQAVGQLGGRPGCAGLALKIKKTREHLFGTAAHRRVHLNSAKCAVPLIPASNPLALGTLATSSRV